MKQKFFKYKIKVIELIDEICSNLFKLQIIIKNIKNTKALINLNVAFIFINLINNETYSMTKYYFKNIKDFIFIYIKK